MNSRPSTTALEPEQCHRLRHPHPRPERRLADVHPAAADQEPVRLRRQARHRSVHGQRRQTRDYVVGVRELDAANLQGNQTNWINKHTVYTHGYGFVAAQADSDVTATNAVHRGRHPTLRSARADSPTPSRRSTSASCSTTTRSSAPRESASTTAATRRPPTPARAACRSVASSAGWHSPSSTSRRTSCSTTPSAPRAPRSSSTATRASEFSRSHRSSRSTVTRIRSSSTVASCGWSTATRRCPTSRTPNSKSLSDLTQDTLSQQRKTASQPNSKINYIRNSVKATVDAYDGTINLYQWDDKDPVLKAWMKAFPGLVQPKSAMPQDVRDHVRYPEDLFEVQRGTARAVPRRRSGDVLQRP